MHLTWKQREAITELNWLFSLPDDEFEAEIEGAWSYLAHKHQASQAHRIPSRRTRFRWSWGKFFSIFGVTEPEGWDILAYWTAPSARDKRPEDLAKLMAERPYGKSGKTAKHLLDDYDSWAKASWEDAS